MSNENSENPAPAAEAAEAPKTEPKRVAAPVALDAGALAPSNAVELGAVLEKIAKGRGFPERFDTAEKRMAAYSLAVALAGRQWQMAVGNIYDNNGQLCIYGELPGKLAEDTGEVQEKEVFAIDAEYKKICIENKNLDAEPYAGVCRIQRKGRVMKEFTYTINDAIKAGLYPPSKPEWVSEGGRWKKTGKRVENPDSPWHKSKKIMLMRRAMGQGVNFEFPDAKIGVPIAEYDYDDLAPDLAEPKDVTPPEARAKRASDLNSRFSTPSQQTATSQPQ